MLKKIFAILLAVLTFLTVLPVCASADVGDNNYIEVESNNGFNEANILPNDATVSGELSYYDIDTYVFTLDYESRVQIFCIADYATLMLAIYDEYGNVIDYGVESFFEDGTPTDGTLGDYPAGTYYIRFLNAEDDWETNTYLFYFVYTVKGNVHSHKYSVDSVAPTCTEQGYSIYTCECGDYYIDNYVDPAHTYYDNYDLICNLCGFEREFTDGWTILNGERVRYENGVIVTNAWRLDNIGWCYLGADGYCVRNKWVKDGTSWCYLDENGYMLTNSWVKDSKGWCYVGNSGYCVTNKWVKDSVGWCYLDSNGRMATNQWIKDSKGWCYVGADGYCVTNKWVKDSKGWCYLDANGRMATNKWIKDSVGWCYVGENGYCVTNKWVRDSKGWCYLNSSGRMSINQWVKDSKGWCYVGTDGYMVTDYWVKDSSGWNYIGSNGYIISHELDYHNHNFSAPTYTKPATCSCGAVNGEPLDLPIYLADEAPFYANWSDYTRVKLDNFYYYMYSDDEIKVHFDAEKLYDYDGNSAGNYVAAKFKLFDENGYLVYDAIWAKEGMTVGEKTYGEYVYLYLDNWSGKGDLTLVIEDY